MSSLKESRIIKKVAEAPKYVVAPTKGLNTEQVEERKKDGLANKRPSTRYKSWGRILMDGFFNLPNAVLVLIIVALILIKADWLSYVFALPQAVIITFGFVGDIRTRRAAKKLEGEAPEEVKVLRNGEKKNISPDDLVLSDIVILHPGDRVPADCLVLEGNCEVEESIITGNAKRKDKEPGSTLFCGSTLTVGQCKCALVAIHGANYGDQVRAKADLTNITKRGFINYGTTSVLYSVGFSIAFLALAFVGFAFANNPSGEAIAQRLNPNNPEAKAFIVGCLGMTASIVPFGLSSLFSLAFATSSYKLIKEKVFIKNCLSLESLGRADTLCFDKTGTLTDGHMAVEDVSCTFGHHRAEVGYAIASILHFTQDKNPTAEALREHFGDYTAESATQICPFDSKRRYSSITLPIGTTYAIGAYESLPLIKDSKIENQIQNNSAQGFRSLILAVSEKPAKGDSLPKNMEIAAVLCLSDNLREESKDTVEALQRDGRSVYIITGDDPLLASTLAKKSGIEGSEAFVSLEGMTDEEILSSVSSYRIFGRATPEQKALIVSQLKRQRKRVAMIGDGVNDMLAMRCADVSLAMGNGSESAIALADIVMVQGGFASLPGLLKEGGRCVGGLGRIFSLLIGKAYVSLVFAFLCLIFSFFAKNGDGSTFVYPFSTASFWPIEVFALGIPPILVAVLLPKYRPKLYPVRKSPSTYVWGALIALLIFAPIGLSLYFPDLLSKNPNDPMQAGLSIASMVAYPLIFLYLWKVHSPIDKLHALLFVAFTVFGFTGFALDVYFGRLIFSDISSLGYLYAGLAVAFIVLAYWLFRLIELGKRLSIKEEV